MSKLRVNAFSISLDGYGAGPNQSRETPLGEGGESLHEWIFPTRMFRTLYGNGDGETGPDNDFAERSFENLGAWIMGRNMFGPVRGEWPDETWRGWWGANPPYHCDVFVLTPHARAPLEMEGGTVFHFVTDGIHAALERARASADGKDIRLGGGAGTIREYLRAGRAAAGRDRPPQPRVPDDRARRNREGYPLRPDQAELTLAHRCC